MTLKNDIGRKSKIKRSHISQKKIMKGGNPYDTLSRKLLTREILNEKILKDIDQQTQSEDFINYLIDKYYETFNLTKQYDENGKLIPINIRHNHYIDDLANEIVNKIISDVTKIESNPKNKFIILAPGDTPSKIIGFINLIEEYVLQLKEYNIYIVLFPMSRAVNWDDESANKYIEEILKYYINNDDKKDTSKIYFGVLDAILRGSTLTRLNKTLKALSYTNIIEEPPKERKDLEGWHPNFGYNLLGYGRIYESAENYESFEGIGDSRCTPSYKVENYKNKK